MNLFAGEEDAPADINAALDVELTEPHKIFNGLGRRDLEDLRRDIKIYVDLGADQEYWNALLSICDDELGRASHGSNRTAYGK